MSDLPWLDEIEARANAATLGPWDWDVIEEILEDQGGYWLDEPIWIVKRLEDGRTILGDTVGKEEDAVFVAHAREDVPRLCRAVRELHARLRGLRMAAESVLMAYDAAAAEANPQIIQEALKALKTQVMEADMAEARWSQCRSSG